MEKKYECCFIEGAFIKEKSDKYKKCCAFEDKPTSEPFTKFYDKHLFRKSLKCKMQNQGENITVILMNPSYADEYGLDKTLCKVREFLEQTGKFSGFEVLNIFPVRTPDSDGLLKVMQKYGNYQEENKRYIIETLKNSKKVLLAWGNDYHKDAQWIFDHLNGKELYVYYLNKGGKPRHFAPQAYNRVAEKKLIKVTPYQNKKGMWHLKANLA
ncbi:MAG: DUF1643 domain-containing protein [Candidatus Gastranaerophilales bacterium]|nr:DUF1643 domain-containing protein [Candidatus Gastranaerophilales bacterium]